MQIDTVEAAHFADDFASKMTNNIIDRNAKLQEMASQMDGTVDKINQLKGEFGTKLNASATNIQNTAIDMNNTRQDRVDHRNDWINGAGNAIKNVLNDKSFTIDPSQFGNTLGDIAGNTKDTANNTKQITDEDLKNVSFCSICVNDTDNNDRCKKCKAVTQDEFKWKHADEAVKLI